MHRLNLNGYEPDRHHEDGGDHAQPCEEKNHKNPLSDNISAPGCRIVRFYRGWKLRPFYLCLHNFILIVQDPDFRILGYGYRGWLSCMVSRL